ncbi:hypothetical protein ACFWSP_31080, partial [Streptomyces sp. NPDC058618]
DDRETITSGSAGGRAEKDLPRQTPRRAADPTACARVLGERLTADPVFRLLAPVRLNVVCFTLAQDPTAARLAALREAASAEVFVTPTHYAGTPALRAAFSNWRTTQADAHRAAEALRTAARETA